MVDHKAVKEKEKETVKKDWREDVQLPAKFDQHRTVFLAMITELESMWDGHHGRTNVSKHCMDLTNDEVRQVHSAAYHTRQT